MLLCYGYMLTHGGFDLPKGPSTVQHLLGMVLEFDVPSTPCTIQTRLISENEQRDPNSADYFSARTIIAESIFALVKADIVPTKGIRSQTFWIEVKLPLLVQ